MPTLTPLISAHRILGYDGTVLRSGKGILFACGTAAANLANRGASAKTISMEIMASVRNVKTGEAKQVVQTGGTMGCNGYDHIVQGQGLCAELPNGDYEYLASVLSHTDESNPILLDCKITKFRVEKR